MLRPRCCGPLPRSLALIHTVAPSLSGCLAYIASCRTQRCRHVEWQARAANGRAPWLLLHLQSRLIQWVSDSKQTLRGGFATWLIPSKQSSIISLLLPPHPPPPMPFCLILKAEGCAGEFATCQQCKQINMYKPMGWGDCRNHQPSLEVGGGAEKSAQTE